MNKESDLQEAADEFHRLLMVPEVRNISYEQLLAYLAERVSALLKNDFAALVQLLYRIDIPEEKLRYFLQANTGEMAVDIIAKLMIERQLQKVETRRLFKMNNDIAEEDRW